MCHIKLEVQAKTKNERDWTWEDVATNTTEDLGIDAIILGDAEYVRNCTINTSYLVHSWSESELLIFLDTFNI